VTLQPYKEFRLKGGSAILDCIRRFSATEKLIFGILVLTALWAALIMAGNANGYFMTEVPAEGGALHEGEVGLPHTVNPVLAVTDVDRDISSLVYAGLTKYKDGSIVPDLASGWSVSADGLSYAFTLRPGIEWSDGTPLNADDVVFTVERIQDPSLKSPRAAEWAGVTATATSPTSVLFTLRQPYSPFLANTGVGIIPRHIWSHVSDDQFIFSEYNIEPVGAGPYKVAGVDRDQGGIPTGYRLSAWNGYFGKKPYVTDIDFSFFPDQDHALSALESGTIDSLPSVPPQEAAKLASNSGEPYAMISAPLSRIFGVFFNQNMNAALADPAVRQALDMSVDRSALVGTVLYGYGKAVSGPLPPSLGSGETAVGQTDVAGAQALLEKSGWKKGDDGIYAKKAAKGSAKVLPLSISLYTADAPDLKQAAGELKDSWIKLGAGVDVKVFEPSELYQNIIRTRAYDALLFGEAAGRDNDLFAFWHSSQRNAPGLNVAMYANSKVDKILEGIRSATGTDAMAASYAELDQMIGADFPAVFLYAPDFVYAVPKALKGVDLGVMTAPADRFGSVSDWYLGTERVWKIFAK